MAERGQAIVEFVFVLPFMLVLLFGIIDFGIAVNNASDLNQVAAATARRLAVNSSSTFDPTAYFKASAESAVRNNTTLTIVYCLPGGSTPGPNAAISVKATMTRNIHIIPGFPSIASVNLKGRATMRLEMPANFVGSGSAATSQAPCD